MDLVKDKNLEGIDLKTEAKEKTEEWKEKDRRKE